MSKREIRLVCLIASLVMPLIACVSPISDPLGRKYALEETQRHYTELIRWGEYDRASDYVPPSHRDAFDDSIARLKGFRVTDYEVGRIDIDEDHTRADVTVTYHGYAETTLIERPVVEHQAWSREGMSNHWFVEPSRPSLTQIH
ncbi:hypothetical protein MK489_10015 [Myxococcota bacterium]|nr:hypothetical protein [Myxococcota bacterium]